MPGLGNYVGRLPRAAKDFLSLSLFSVLHPLTVLFSSSDVAIDICHVGQFPEIARALGEGLVCFVCPPCPFVFLFCLEALVSRRVGESATVVGQPDEHVFSKQQRRRGRAHVVNLATTYSVFRIPLALSSDQL